MQQEKPSVSELLHHMQGERHREDQGEHWRGQEERAGADQEDETP